MSETQKQDSQVVNQKALNELKEMRDPSVFSVLLKVLAFVSLIASCVVGIEKGSYDFGFGFYLIGGILSFFWWWALSIIVDACAKYLKKED